MVIAKQAEPLERFAASELERYVKRLFCTSVSVVTSPSETASPLFCWARLLITRAASSALRAFHGSATRDSCCGRRRARIGRRWRLSAAVRRRRCGACTSWSSATASPICSSGDVYPEKRQPLFLPEIDRVFEPTFKARWFKTMGDFAMGMEGWGMADYRPCSTSLPS